MSNNFFPSVHGLKFFSIRVHPPLYTFVQDIRLVHMKAKFSVRLDDSEIVLSEIIDNESWRIWPSNDDMLLKDKQVTSRRLGNGFVQMYIG